MFHLLSWFLCVSLSTGVGDETLVVPVPSRDNLPAWRTYVLPRSEEIGHEAMPWLLTFGEGMLAASEQEKPLLFWAMNGHPLGCT